MAEKIKALPCRCPERGIHVHEMELIPLLESSLATLRTDLHTARQERDDAWEKIRVLEEKVQAGAGRGPK